MLEKFKNFFEKFKNFCALLALLKARHFIKKHDYTALFYTFSKHKDLEKLYFKGFTLIHFAILLSENNALKLLLRQKLSILKHEEEPFEAELKRFLLEIQYKGLALDIKDTQSLCSQRVQRKFLKNYKKEKINFKNANSADLASFYGNIFALELFKKILSKPELTKLCQNSFFYALKNGEYFALNWLFINAKNEAMLKNLKKQKHLSAEESVILALLFDDISDFKKLLAQNLLSMRDKFKNHAVHLSVAFNKPKFLNALLCANKSLLELKNAEDKGLLDIAVEFGSFECFIMLVKDYAQDFSTQFFNAVCAGNEKILSFYKTHYKPTDYELSMLYYMWFELGDKDFLARLAAFSLECKDPQGDTPLLNAVKFNLYDRVKALINAGADINALDKEGQNALFYATKQGGKALIALLSSQMTQDFEEY